MQHTRHRKTLACLLSVALSILALPPAQAALATFTRSADFFAALTAAGAMVTTETYETQPPDTLIADGATLDGITYDFPAGVMGRIDTLFIGLGAQDLAGSRPPEFFSFFAPGESITVTFPSPVRGFGIFFNIFASPAGSLFATTGRGDTVTTGGPIFDIASLYFAGLIADRAFSSVTFGATPAATSGYTVDNLTRATLPSAPVPEPGTLLLATLGVAALAGARRRRS